MADTEESPLLKRPKFDIKSFNTFSRAEQTVLKGAAEILEMPLENLLAAAVDSSRSNSGVSTQTLGTASTLEPAVTEAVEERDGIQLSDLQCPTPNDRRLARKSKQPPQIARNSEEASLPQTPSIDIATSLEYPQGSSVQPWLDGCIDPISNLDLGDFEPGNPDRLNSWEAIFAGHTASFSDATNADIENILPHLPITQDDNNATTESYLTHLWPALESDTAITPKIIELDYPSQNESASSLSRSAYAQTLEKIPSGSLFQKGKKSRKKREVSTKPDKQKESTVTRRVGACIRCSIQRTRVRFSTCSQLKRNLSFQVSPRSREPSGLLPHMPASSPRTTSLASLSQVQNTRRPTAG